MAVCELCQKNEGERYATYGKKETVVGREMLDGKDKKRTKTVYDGPFENSICADCVKKRNRNGAILFIAIAAACAVGAVLLSDIWRIAAIACAAFFLFMFLRQITAAATQKKGGLTPLAETMAKELAQQQHPGYPEYLSRREYEMTVGAAPN